MGFSFNPRTGQYTYSGPGGAAPRPAAAKPKSDSKGYSTSGRNPGPPPWAKGAGPGLSSTPKTDKPRTILSSNMPNAPKPSIAGRLASMATSSARQFGQSAAQSARTGRAATPKSGWSFGKVGRVGSTNTYGARFRW